MKKRNLLYLLLAVVLPLSYVSLSSFSAQKFNSSTSGCGGGSCHGTNTTITNLAVTGMPSTGYVGGTTYSLTFTVDNPNMTQTNARGGFNVTCTDGSFASSTGVKVNTGNNKEITHDGAKALSSGAVSWTTDWTAPATGTGNVTFNFAGNASDGTFTTANDQPNKDIFPFQEAASTSMAPSITGVSVSNIMGTTATVNAMINANGAQTTGAIEYGLTTNYGSTGLLSPLSFTGNTASAATSALTGLTPNTTYNYRVTTVNSVGNTNSPNGTFTTGAPNAVPEFTKGEFTIFPNPASDNLNIRLDESVQSYKVEIYSMNGQRITQPNVSSSDKELKVNLTAMAKGTYLLNATVNEKRILQKITIN